MRKIPLTQGQFAMVDDEDFDYLNQWKWYASKQSTGNFYAVRGVRGENGSRNLFMHRIIMKAENIFVDHIDGNGLNNQKGNLRFATSSQNSSNKRSQKQSTSKYLGVSWHHTSKKWQVHIRKGLIKIHVGLFIDEKDAALAYNKKAIEFHGDFANTNKII